MSQQDPMNQGGGLLVPTVFEKDGNGVRGYDLISRLLKDRIVWLPSDVNPGSVNILQMEMMYLQNDDAKKPIKVYINSPGGSIHDGNGLVDAMQIVTPPIHTYCVGLAASYGAVLLAAGEPGERYITRRSWVMLHQPHTGEHGIGGQVTDILINAKQLEALKLQLAEDLFSFLNKDAPNCPETIEELMNDMERDFWLTAQEAVDYGVADNVLSRKPS